MILLIEALSYQVVNQGLLNSNLSSLKYMVIDPFNAINNIVNFSAPHQFNNSDMGSSDDGHLIVVSPSSDDSGGIVRSVISNFRGFGLIIIFGEWLDYCNIFIVCKQLQWFKHSNSGMTIVRNL